MNGFYMYRQLDGVKFMPPSKHVSKSAPRRGKIDDMLDLVFAVDPHTNLPSGSVSQYLSDKTNEQVREWIRQNILIDLPDTEMSVPSSLRDDLLSLDSEFIAKVSRNRYESKEDYEARVESYFKDIEDDKEYQRRLKLLRKKFSDGKTDK